MKKYFKQFLFLAFFLSSFLLWQKAEAACSGASPIWYATPDQTSVKNCYDSASAGDTINVSAGTATWSTTYNNPENGNYTCLLCANKGVNIIGGYGGGATEIINGSTTSGPSGGPYIVMIHYNDSAADEPFRLSGFTFDANGQKILRLGYPENSPSMIRNKVRIDHNAFINSASANGENSVIDSSSILFGVFDNNIIDVGYYPIRHANGAGVDNWWQENSVMKNFSLGSENYMYFEDNTIILSSSVSDDGIVTDGQFSARYVFRYNAITSSIPSYSLFEIHGQQGNNSGEMAASFGVELYGNQVSSGSNFITLFKQRSGQTRIFNNNIITTSSNPLIRAYNGTLNVCPSAYTADKITHNSYWWGNRKNTTGAYPDVEADHSDSIGTCAGLENNPLLGRDVFSESTTPGISCGILANLPTTCTAGQGYWATNQSCTDLTGMVGANPTTPISGTLYKCTATDTWEEYYTPYTYPHPLRGESTSDTIAPAAPTNLAVQ